jgi:UrcA family protein
MGSTIRNRAIYLVLAIGITIPAVGSAAAPSQIDGDAVKVSYADLDIDSRAGAKALYSRLKRASAHVCGIESYTTVRSLSVRRTARDCYLETLEGSVREIGSDVLAEIHAS